MKLFVIDTANLNLKEYKSKFYFKKDQQLELGSKIIKDYLLKYLGWNKNDFTLMKYINGKPYFKFHKSKLIIDFNVSHDENKVVLFYNFNKDVGIDIMLIKDRKTSFFDNIITNFTQEEQLLLKTSKNYLTDFYKLWTFKEAYFKYLGIGLENLDQINYVNLEKVNNKIKINNYNFKIKEILKKDNIYFIELMFENYLITLCFDYFKDNLEIIEISE